jgi:hypothetical protein
MIHNNWLSIANHDSQPLGSSYDIMIQNHFAQHNTSRFTITGLRIAQYDSQPLAQNITPLILSQPVVVNHS